MVFAKYVNIMTKIRIFNDPGIDHIIEVMLINWKQSRIFRGKINSSSKSKAQIVIYRLIRKIGICMRPV